MLATCLYVDCFRCYFNMNGERYAGGKDELR